MSDISDSSKPHLLRGVKLKHDEVRQQWILLAPERMINANPIAVEVLKRCDGKALFSEIIDDLAATFKAEPEIVARDVRALLTSLLDKKMVGL